MAKHRNHLSPELTAAICSLVRAGAFGHIAAEAKGIPRNIFMRWMKNGQSLHGKKIYKDFYYAVLQARAQARAKAEVDAHSSNPLAWLRSGPGREMKEEPGWTQASKPTYVATDNRSVNLLLHPEMVKLFAMIMQLLAPYPEARKAVAGALTAQPAEPSPITPPS